MRSKKTRSLSWRSFSATATTRWGDVAARARRVATSAGLGLLIGVLRSVCGGENAPAVWVVGAVGGQHEVGRRDGGERRGPVQLCKGGARAGREEGVRVRQVVGDDFFRVGQVGQGQRGAGEEGGEREPDDAAAGAQLEHAEGGGARGGEQGGLQLRGGEVVGERDAGVPGRVSARGEGGAGGHGPEMARNAVARLFPDAHRLAGDAEAALNAAGGFGAGRAEVGAPRRHDAVRLGLQEVVQAVVRRLGLHADAHTQGPCRVRLLQRQRHGEAAHAGGPLHGAPDTHGAVPRGDEFGGELDMVREEGVAEVGGEGDEAGDDGLVGGLVGGDARRLEEADVAHGCGGGWGAWGTWGGGGRAARDGVMTVSRPTSGQHQQHQHRARCRLSPVVSNMYRRGDPRWNRTIQHISENLEHANETAAENLYGFTQRYVNPCLASLAQCCNAAAAPCCPSSDRRRRTRSHARAELSFDFYDDWEHDESDGLLGWGHDNLERFLGSATTYGATTQPARPSAMTYPRARDPRFDAARRKSAAHARDAQDPTLIPRSSYFGFLGRLPFNLRGKALRYRPSAADLADHPRAARRPRDDEHPLIEDSGEDRDAREPKTHRRARSNTHTSGHTTDSLSSRGDIFPSEDELDDAVPLDDEFTIALERRSTAQWDDAQPSRSNSKRPSRTIADGEDEIEADADAADAELGESLSDLKREEEDVRIAEETEIQRKRIEAQYLAVQRGLATTTSLPSPASEMPVTTTSTHDTTHDSVPDTAHTHAPPPWNHSAHTTPNPDPHTDRNPDPDNDPDNDQDSASASDPNASPGPSRPVTALRRPPEDGLGDGFGEGFVPARLPNFGGG